MADSGSHRSGYFLDIQQILFEAQTRWLRPAEISEILQNYRNFRIASEPPNRPTSGSLFLFDRKVLRYFRKDGHNWRKKKDGKTVKEAHEKLKVGSVDMLHCYYAHGEEDENFQRRSYWLLEQDYMHIVLVHYLEVKCNKANIGCTRETEQVASNFQKESQLSFDLLTSNSKLSSGTVDSASPTSTLISVCEDAESEDTAQQASSRFCSFLERKQRENGSVRDKMNADPLNPYVVHSHLEDHKHCGSSIFGEENVSLPQGDESRDSDDSTIMIESQKMLDLASWEQTLDQCKMGFRGIPCQTSVSCSQPATTGVIVEQEHIVLGQSLADDNSMKPEYRRTLPTLASGQIPFEDNSLHLHQWPMDQKMNLDSACDLDMRYIEEKANDANVQNNFKTFGAYPDQQFGIHLQNNFQMQHLDAKFGHFLGSNSGNNLLIEGKIVTNEQSLDVSRTEEGLKKVDSFSRWIAKELGEVDELHLQSTSGISWASVESEEVVDSSQLQLDTYSLSPSLSQNQLFSIIDFSPNWAYSDIGTKVLITGTFLMSQDDIEKCKWSCMFGEIEVPAEVLADGVLRCHAPPHTAGRIPFYVSCSNRLACSEVREFEYQVGFFADRDTADIYNSNTRDMLLEMRLESLLSLRSVGRQNYLDEDITKKESIINKLILLREEASHKMVNTVSDKEFSQSEEKERLLQKLMKEKLYSWLLHKVTEVGKGPSVLDDGGQGVLHFTAALGYDWAIQPTVVAGVNINFRDVNGWTALHWAAFCGREHTVAVLVSLGAASGALTDPTPKFPLGRTPADLASANGHKGISGFLAESSLTSYLSSLTINDKKEIGTLAVSGVKAVQTFSERTATPISDGDIPDILSLKDSLSAVCNATQAADRIHQVFRMHSFEMKQVTESVGIGLSDENALSLVAVRRRKFGRADAAATHIQKKFRGWKKRKEFLIIRQRIVKIQAHVRGHQVRKQYRAITWSVGILEKVILRWRRKGSGLRGFRSDALLKGSGTQAMGAQEDDYDFLKEGRKQTEERYQKALARVKSMVQYPEARDQYRRLLTVVEGFRETKGTCNTPMDSSQGAADGDDDLIDIAPLLDDDNLMSIAFE